VLAAAPRGTAAATNFIVSVRVLNTLAVPKDRLETEVNVASSGPKGNSSSRRSQVLFSGAVHAGGALGCRSFLLSARPWAATFVAIRAAMRQSYMNPGAT
jgi:hypothetical protein